MDHLADQLAPEPRKSMTDLLCTLVVLCRGITEEDTPFWAYMAVKPSDAQLFKEARDKGSFHLEDYGTVIEWGDGHTPPDAIKERMYKEYGVRDDYEEKLQRIIDKLTEQ